MHPDIDKHGQNSPTLAEIQQTVDEWIRSIGVRYFSELTNLAQLVEEVGELSRIISRTYGEQSWKSDAATYNLADEMADVLFVLVCLANQTGVDLTAAVKANLQKKTERDRDRHQNNPKLKSEASS
jgi:NTP pyrophosphatase (non-canonical NTP hydrolase)